jgi:hypothetical protein
LRIESVPEGASVYLDGALKGVTPIDLPASGDRHKLALILPGHTLHRAEIDGSSKIAVELTPTPKFAGAAGIKVRCRSKSRFYVIVDGQHTGMLCPTDRLGVKLGKHTVEVYDPVTDSTQVHELDIEDTHSSARVRIDE